MSIKIIFKEHRFSGENNLRSFDEDVQGLFFLFSNINSKKVILISSIRKIFCKEV
jgi:hypothetical protein